jgi:hypothetical protein
MPRRLLQFKVRTDVAFNGSPFAKNEERFAFWRILHSDMGGHEASCRWRAGVENERPAAT